MYNDMYKEYNIRVIDLYVVCRRAVNVGFLLCRSSACVAHSRQARIVHYYLPRRVPENLKSAIGYARHFFHSAY